MDVPVPHDLPRNRVARLLQNFSHADIKAEWQKKEAAILATPTPSGRPFVMLLPDDTPFSGR